MSALSEHEIEPIDTPISTVLLDDLGQWLGNHDEIAPDTLARLHDENERLALLSFLHRHWLMGAFIQRLKTSSLFSGLEPDFQEYLEHIERFYLTRNERIKDEVVFACRILHENNIPAIVMKGASGLFNETFHPLSIRFMTDIDLLVPEREQAKAIQCLLDAGYWQDQDEMDISAANHHHAPPLARDNQGLCLLEIHQWPIKKRYQPILPLEDIWNNAEPLPLTTDRVAQQLSATEQLILSVAHCELSHRAYEEKYLDWRQLHNSACLIHRFAEDIHWDSVTDTFEQTGHLPELRAHLYMVETYFGVNVPITVRTEQAKAHLQQCIELLVERQGKSNPWTTVKSILSGYKKENIDVMYGANNMWQLTLGRIKHAKRHIKMLTKPKYFNDFINRLRN
ncbi:nucleotidyltransferase family protein [Thalassotalea sp. Y01]|uniref:nucleotidyltransferase family protein n=1 Tax=Thalassotalea sp. Y01 TaxID=2729613 RepID=UPI00145EAB27|nr:nucleotidyltransferase family protein [Thalassotalea sp. Y01]NMP16487.1 nucleotidyltransferase family protein [Thalassotalea sp. Y01]